MKEKEKEIINSQINRMSDALETFNQWFNDCVKTLQHQINLMNDTEQ